MSVQLTESAADHVKTMLEKRGHGVGLRLGIRVSGCTGYAYVVDYADCIEENDTVYESFGIKTVVDAKSIEALTGMTVDYTRDNLLNQGFEFNNPNVQDSCGCGESFNIKTQP